jgi:preprotein translocase subunit SecD
MDEKGVEHDSAEYKAAVGRYEAAVRESVFDGDSVAQAEMRRYQDQILVYFEFQPERKAEFAAFTEKHVNESLAIIVDGKIETAPSIKSKLPGAGVIEGGRGHSFTEQEATELAAVISSGKFAGRLVHVSTEGLK